MGKSTEMIKSVKSLLIHRVLYTLSLFCVIINVFIVLILQSKARIVRL